MRNLIEKIPIPMSGLMLGLFAIAKLYHSLNMDIGTVFFFCLGILLFGLLVAKAFLSFETVLKELQNPIIASVAPTFSMGTMVMANMLMEYSSMAIVLWGFGFTLQILLVGYFVYQFIWRSKLSLSSVFPSWFILFVGLGIVPITAVGFLPFISHVLFWVVLCFYIVLFPIVLKRLKAHPLEGGTKPLFVILTAPGSICLTAYLGTFQQANSFLAICLLVVSQLIYVVVIWQLPKLLILPFYPSYAAFTFPLVISATALYTFSSHFDVAVLVPFTYIELLIASCILLYVFIRYMKSFDYSKIIHS